MFSGIVKEVGKIEAVAHSEQGAVLKVSGGIFGETKIGDSISISGVCLTATEVSGQVITFDLSSETLRATALIKRKVGDKVNLELAVTAETLLNGHIVQGHVDCAGNISEIKKEGDTYRVQIGLNPAALKYLVAKGSVCVEGVSLTVGELGDSQFSVYIIPTTWSLTTFQFLTVGDLVNVEVDILAKYVERLCQK